MKRETAERIVESVKQLDIVFGKLHLLMEEIDDELERRKLRRASAELILDVYEKITREISNQFPDLGSEEC